jgi:hypothetical protein
MRSRFLAIPFALLLAVSMAGVAAAETTPPGEGGSVGGLDVAIMSIGVSPKTGLVTVSGEITCEVDFEWTFAQVELSQVVGRLFTVRGWGWADPDGCTAADGAVAFSTSFYAESGRFAPGKAQVTIEAYGEGGCSEDPETGEYNCENWGWASHGPLPIRLQATR